ncbi:streptomycin resistance protein, StrB [Salmonella enterica subsp. enterica serovar Schwarzengrund str. SL480]|nr:streptomycin resistance protein, StrB [Salmonella enterica subsp. enterica serovar Schwarzengrund str. SL480]
MLYFPFSETTPYGCLSAAWNADGEEEQRDLAIAAAIKQVRQTSY